MSNEKKSIYTIATVATIVLLLLICSSMGYRCTPPEESIKRCGHPVSNWLLDFQGLVAGLLASAAAFATIRQMRRTERREQANNSKMIKLAMRPEARIVRRHAFYNLERMQRIADGVEMINCDFYKKQCFRKKKIALFPVLYSMSEFIAIYDDDKGLELYDAAAFNKLQFLYSQRHKLDDARQKLSNVTATDIPGESQDNLKKRIEDALMDAEILINTWSSYCEIIARNLRELVDEYEIVNPMSGEY